MGASGLENRSGGYTQGSIPISTAYPLAANDGELQRSVKPFPFGLVGSNPTYWTFYFVLLFIMPIIAL